MGNESARVVIEREADGAITINGELDAFTSPMLDEAIDATVPAVGEPVVVDLAAVTFIDSSALQVLVGHHQRLESNGQRLELRKPSETVNRLLEVSGLADHLLVVD